MRNFLVQQQDLSFLWEQEQKGKKQPVGEMAGSFPFPCEQCLFSGILFPFNPLQAVTPCDKPCHRGQAEADERWQ